MHFPLDPIYLLLVDGSVVEIYGQSSARERRKHLSSLSLPSALPSSLLPSLYRIEKAAAGARQQSFSYPPLSYDLTQLLLRVSALLLLMLAYLYHICGD